MHVLCTTVSCNIRPFIMLSKTKSQSLKVRCSMTSLYNILEMKNVERWKVDY